MKLPAGSDIVLQLHYTTNGKAVQDRTRIGLRFSKTPPRMEITSHDTATSKFAIPPGADNHRVTATRTVKEEVELLGMTPHMHLRGRAMNVYVQDADGSQRELLRVPKWDFNWQFEYKPAQRTLLQPGQKLFVEAFYDNSPNNPHNPDPSKEVRWGDQTWDEMMFCGVTTARPLTLDRSATPAGGSPYQAKPRPAAE